jgi:hypothetical protein
MSERWVEGLCSGRREYSMKVAGEGGWRAGGPLVRSLRRVDLQRCVVPALYWDKRASAPTPTCPNASDPTV